MDTKVCTKCGEKKTVNNWSNVCLSCPDCNLVKGTKTAEEFMS